MITPPPDPVPQSNIQYNVKINTRTMLEKLYTHDIDTLIEFPETSSSGSIGHLFRMKPGTSWFNPARNFAYSRGEPSGSTGRKPAFCNVLVDTLGNKYDNRGQAFIRCEHYNRTTNVDHLIDWDAGRGLYDTRYLEALFSDDADVIAEYEEDGLAVSDLGPFAVCSTVANFSSIKVNCPHEHRDENGNLALLEMQHLECKSKFRIFEPFEEQREICPYILVVCHGAHTHPIPLPTKTSPGIRDEIFARLSTLDHDLPDLTPRRFLRHPTTNVFLQKRLPGVINPTLLDLHSSLGNCDHIRTYILQAQENIFPDGTGWEGLLYLKKQQDEQLPPEEAYIRYLAEIPAVGITSDPSEDDDSEEFDPDVPFRIAVCMTKEGSIRLLQAKFLQSDIAFRRIVGFKEFELGALERPSRTTIVYCRIFVNRQTAMAHQIIFQKIHEIIFTDTGEHLKW
ncbi:hypothetical protein MSAN_00488200 [Mycena sanguinolenta]|uniref:Uncharacterized protein n=1 Tax=Mycena sanguinolenta TaxID=230812 RepID=A0A8H7DH03_9AGAR|nr:hypothetical protein MSAN_00488200 [Mycena sanguinolenta]